MKNLVVCLELKCSLVNYDVFASVSKLADTFPLCWQMIIWPKYVSVSFSVKLNSILGRTLCLSWKDLFCNARNVFVYIFVRKPEASFPFCIYNPKISEPRMFNSTTYSRVFIIRKHKLLNFQKQKFTLTLIPPPSLFIFVQNSEKNSTLEIWSFRIA